MRRQTLNLRLCTRATPGWQTANPGADGPAGVTRSSCAPAARFRTSKARPGGQLRDGATPPTSPENPEVNPCAADCILDSIHSAWFPAVSGVSNAQQATPQSAASEAQITHKGRLPVSPAPESLFSR